MKRRNARKINRSTSKKYISSFFVAIFIMLGLTSNRVMANDVLMEPSLPVQDNPYITNKSVSFVIQPKLTPNPGSLCSTAWYDISGYNSFYSAYLTLNTNSVLKSTNSGSWEPSFSQSGLYKVEAFIADHPSLYWSCINQTISPDTHNAKYVINHANGETRVSRDQQPLVNQWLDLGTYKFNAGQDGKVTLSDLNNEAHATHFVSFSAMRFTLVEEADVVMPTLTPSPGSLCSTAWYNISSYNSFYPAYLTLNTNNSSKSTNYGIWRPNLSQSGLYKVEAFVANHPSLYWSCIRKSISPDTRDARYVITHANGNDKVSLNQRPLVNQWLDLGTYNFIAGTAGKVRLSDFNGEAHASHFVSFSAMRFSPIDTSGCVAPNAALSVANHQLLNNDSCDILPTGKIIYPYENENKKPKNYPVYGPGDTIRIEAEASDPLNHGIKRVEFWVLYDGEWHRIRDEYYSPYEADFVIPDGIKTQIIEIGIHVVSNDGRVAVDPGGKRYANYQQNLDSKWVSVDKRAYLNQYSICLNATDDGCVVNGSLMCGSVATAMVLAMNDNIPSDYNTLVETAKDVFVYTLDRYPRKYYGLNWYQGLAQYMRNRGMNVTTRKAYRDQAWETITDEIKAGYPVIAISDRWGGERIGHYFVIVGYQENSFSGERTLIVYDSGGEWNGETRGNNVDRNSSDPNSHKGQWVFYEFDEIWGNNSDSPGFGRYFIVRPQTQSSAQASVLQAETSVQIPDIISDESEDWQPLEGIDSFDDYGPKILSIERVNTNPASTPSIEFAITFDEIAVGVDITDFVLTTTGVSGALVSNVSGSGDIYIVTVNTGTGNGSIRLDLIDDDSIVDKVGNPLGGSGSDNGDYTSGEEYEIIKTSTCIFSGTIDIQGRSDGTGATFTVVGSETFSTTTDAAGSYELSVPEDTYDVTAEMDRYLDGERTGDVCLAGEEIQLPSVTLLGGDTNDDCVINILDLSFMGSRFMTSAGDANYDLMADINDDGEINILDLSVTGGNFMGTCPVNWP